MSSSSINVLVPVADGSEEIETSTIVDTLVRGGATVTVASVHPHLVVTCSRGLKLCADKYISDCKGHMEWDMIVCPGGMPGANHLHSSTDLKELLQHQKSKGKFIAAICAAPAVVLQPHGLLDGLTRVTCYPVPKFTNQIPSYTNDRVCVDGNVITSQGPATSLAFSLKLVELLFGKKKSDDVAAEMLFVH